VKASTTKLSLDNLRDQGYIVDVVERWVPSGSGGQQVRRDLFGILDLVAIRDAETLGVQTTTKANAAARARKIARSDHFDALTQAGWRIVVHGWWQPNGPGTRYRVEEFDVTGEV
jgi:hypothetical protein